MKNYEQTIDHNNKDYLDALNINYDNIKNASMVAIQSEKMISETIVDLIKEMKKIHFGEIDPDVSIYEVELFVCGLKFNGFMEFVSKMTTLNK